MDSVLSCMVSDEIGPGTLSTQFVKAVAEYMGIAGGLAFREQSRALGAALDVLGLEPGSLVVLSPLSPAYYVTVLLERELEPVYADVDPFTGCLDPSGFEKLRAVREPAAVLLRYPLGSVPDTEAFHACGIPVIEDISTAFGVDLNGAKAGSSSKYVILSLEEDGIITTAGGSLFMSSSRGILSEVKKQAADKTRSIIMTNLNAALGIVQIKQVDAFLAKRREIREVFVKSVMKTKHKTIMAEEERDMGPYSFPVLLKSGVQNTIRYAAKHGIRVIPAFESCAGSVYPLETCECPNAEVFRLRCVLFPLYPRLGGQNIQLVSRVLSTLP